jgi:hypothetical protein
MAGIKKVKKWFPRIIRRNSNSLATFIKLSDNTSNKFTDLLFAQQI